MKNKEKKQRILDHFEGHLELNPIGKCTIDEANFLLLRDIKNLLEQLLEKQNQQPETVTADPPVTMAQATTSPEKKSKGWKFWK